MHILVILTNGQITSQQTFAKNPKTTKKKHSKANTSDWAEYLLLSWGQCGLCDFAGNHCGQSGAWSNMKERNGRRERNPLRRWVLIQELALKWDGGGCEEEWGGEKGGRWRWRDGNLDGCVGGSKRGKKWEWMGWRVGWHRWGAGRQQSFTSGSAGRCREPKARIKCSGHELSLSINVT